jgi:hypothetical protein
MALTCRSMLYRCEFDLAREIAELAGLRCVLGDKTDVDKQLDAWIEQNPMPSNTIPWDAPDDVWGAEEKRIEPLRSAWWDARDVEDKRIKDAFPKPVYGEWAEYWAWEDRATGGGGCRITWKEGICWISAHSGYAYADITGEVSELFLSSGKAIELDEYALGYPPNPRSYGITEFEAWQARQGN